MKIQYTCHFCFIWQYQPCDMYIHLHTIGLIGMTEIGTATFHFAPNRRRFHWSIFQWILLRRKNLRQKLKSNLTLFMPYSLLTKIWKVAVLPILVLFHWYICLCVCISVIKPITDVQRKPSWKGPMLMWTSFLHLEVYLLAQLTSIWKLHFEPSQIATVTNCDTIVTICNLSQFVIKAVTAQTESNNTENVFWVLGRVPMFTFWHEYEKFHICRFCCYFTGTSILMYISYKAHNRCTKETFLLGSDVDVNIFSALRSIPSGIIDINLKSCVLNRHKLRQSQIATLSSQFVICRNLWSRPWRGILIPITVITCSGYLGEYPCLLLTWIWKAVFLPILVLFHWHICWCVCISVMKLMIDVPRKPSWKLLWLTYKKLCFERSQIATVANCENSGIPAVAICDLSQFVIKALIWQIDSNNTENVFWVLGRVSRFTFVMNMKSCIFAHFGVITLVYMFMCMFISYKAHNRCTQETVLKGSDFDVSLFYALRSIPSVTMKSIWEIVFWTVTNCGSHKLRHHRRNLWFVAIWDQGRDGTNWVQ